MKNKDSGKANASLVISMLALLMAVTGVATAAKDGGNVKLPPNSVGSAQLKPGAVKATDIGKSAVVASKIKPDAVTTQALAPSAVTAAILAPNSVTGSAIAPSSVVATSLAPNSVTSSAIASGAVDSNALTTGAVTETKIALAAVGGEKIKDNAIGSGALMTGAVTEQKLANGSVDEGKLKDDAVGKDKLKDGAVGEEQIEAGAVTTPKIGPRAVTAIKVDATPGAQVSAGTTQMDFSFLTCFVRSSPPFSMVGRNVGNVYSPSAPERLTAPISGLYRVTAGVTWADGGGTMRGLSSSRTIGSGPNIGQHYTVQMVSTAPAVGSKTDQTLSFDVALDQGDYVTVDFVTCGADVDSTSSNFGMVWTGPAN